MKRKIVYNIFFLAFLTLFFISCEKERTTEDHSQITYYVKFELKGDQEMYVPAGSTFTDPGFTATEAGADVASKVEIDGQVDANTPGYYEINYSAVNKDGYAASVTRKVIVFNEASLSDLDISGTYDGKRVSNNTGGPVTITKLSKGIFYITDLMGGYYETGRGYGKAYAGWGYLQLNNDNTITCLYGFVPGWSDDIILKSTPTPVYDPINKVIDFYPLMVGANFGFAVKLTFKE